MEIYWNLSITHDIPIKNPMKPHELPWLNHVKSLEPFVICTICTFFSLLESCFTREGKSPNRDGPVWTWETGPKNWQRRCGKFWEKCGNILEKMGKDRILWEHVRKYMGNIWCVCVYIYNMHINYIAKSVFQVLEFLEMSCSQVIWTSLIAGFNFQPLWNPSANGLAPFFIAWKCHQVQLLCTAIFLLLHTNLPQRRLEISQKILQCHWMTLGLTSWRLVPQLLQWIHGSFQMSVGSVQVATFSVYLGHLSGYFAVCFLH